MKINAGCGPNVLEGYENIDLIPQSEDVKKGTLLEMPFADGSAEEVLAEHIFEHMDFQQEPKAWQECYRVLKPGGRLVLEVPDFEWVCRTFLDAKDDFKAFYKLGALDHYFGNGRALDQRWSIVTTMFFGHQNGAGQYHKTGYTAQKIRTIAAMMDFSIEDMVFFGSKGGQVIRATLIKKG
tara:strand:- start:305 stop:847 length:543 start_codon:yes stop_codon:yes gene_type:complete